MKLILSMLKAASISEAKPRAKLVTIVECPILLKCAYTMLGTVSEIAFF